MDMEGEGDELGDWDWEICIATCKTDNSWEPAVWLRELSLVLCDDLDGWNGGERGPRGRGYMYNIADSLH